MAILASVFAMTHSEVNTDPKTPSSCCIVNVSSSPVVTFDVLTGNLSQNADISSPDDEEDENDGDTVASMWWSDFLGFSHPPSFPSLDIFFYLNDLIRILILIRFFCCCYWDFYLFLSFCFLFLSFIFDDCVIGETKDTVHSNIPRPVLESVVALGLESVRI